MKNNKGLLLTSRELTVENTTYCGASCIFCPRDKYSFKWRHMEMDLFVSVIDQAIELGMLSLDACGFGDPLMDPSFKDKLAYVKNKYPEVKIYISTTAQLLNEDRMDWVCEYVDTLKLSHYGFSKKVFESVHRGSLSYEKIVNNIELLLSRKSTNRPYVIMQFVVLPENKHQMNDWKKYWEPRVDEIMIWTPHNYGGGLDQVGSEPASTGPIKSCGRPFLGNVFVRENGEVSMCCFDYNRQLVIGNLHKQTLREVLEGKELCNIRETHQKGQFDTCRYICKKCDQIRPREDALLHSSNAKRKVGILTTHPDLINDMLTRTQQIEID